LETGLRLTGQWYREKGLLPKQKARAEERKSQ